MKQIGDCNAEKKQFSCLSIQLLNFNQNKWVVLREIFERFPETNTFSF